MPKPAFHYQTSPRSVYHFLKRGYMKKENGYLLPAQSPWKVSPLVEHASPWTSGTRRPGASRPFQLWRRPARQSAVDETASCTRPRAIATRFHVSRTSARREPFHWSVRRAPRTIARVPCHYRLQGQKDALIKRKKDVACKKARKMVTEKGGTRKTRNL